MSKRNNDAKSFAQQKRTRRQWISFMRMCRYGVNNFSRNAWLTVAATAVMTITLLIVFVSLAARNVLLDTVGEIRDKVDMSIYVKNETSQKDADTIKSDLEKLPSVRAVSYSSPENERAKFAEANKNDVDMLSALNNSDNRFSGVYNVKIVDINNTSELANFVANNSTYKEHADPNREPSFAGKRKEVIENIARSVGFVETAGVVAVIVFIAISSLIVFNTIRMAIFNRKDEIHMMKLIGADSSFIRGPFIVEAMVYGVIAAVVATGLGMAALYGSKDKLLSYGITLQPTIDHATLYIGIVILGMIAVGAIIGVVSSLLATHRYLKV